MPFQTGKYPNVLENAPVDVAALMHDDVNMKQF
jgi:hypothetical protein